MKIRTDFVTNSSSATYYLEKDTTILFFDSENEYSFGYSARGYSSWDLKPRDIYSPGVFSQYVSWHYLMKGTKPTVNKIMQGKGTKEFIDYLVRNKKESGEYAVIRTESLYAIGYGESIGNDVGDNEKLIISHLHPAIQRYYEGKNLWSEMVYSKKIDTDSFWIEFNKITGDPEGDKYYFRFFITRYNDCTGEFYRFLWENAGSPELDFDLAEELLKGCGLKANIIAKMKEQDLKIIYAADKTRLNDVIVYFDQNGEIVCEAMCDCIKRYS